MITHLRGALLEADDLDYVCRAMELLESVLVKQHCTPTARLRSVTAKLRETQALLASEHQTQDGCAASSAESWNAAGHASISTAEAARILGCSLANVRDLVSRGRLPAERVGGRWAIDLAAVVRRAEQQP